ncbi:MAG: carboxypeptidase regulatory-like domain-containing protein [Phycisphaerae bacterium]|nr:carboxypeptidase regulatory-like domain-containing protein [Phycisphaerae bacterium]
MSQIQDRELLRRLEMISRIKPSKESTARAMDRAREALLEAAQAPVTEPELPSKTRYIYWRPLTQAAIAAVVIAAISVGIVVWKQTVNRPLGPELAQTPDGMQFNPNLANTDRLKSEAIQIRKLAALADVQGLLNMLETAVPANQQIIASHLAKLAGLEAVPTLSRLAVRWTGPPVANPFTLAITQIQARLTTMARTQTPLEPGTPGTAVVPVATALAGPSLLTGQVTDAATGNPIAGAVVSVSGSGQFETQTNRQGLYGFSELDPKGYYRMKVTAQGYLGLTSLKDMPLVSLSDTSNGTKPLTRDIQLEKGCLVKVHVKDQNGQPVKDVLLTASWLGLDHDNIVGQQVATDTDGQSLVGALEASEIGYLVTAMHPDFVPQHASIECSNPLVDQSLTITLTRGQTVPAFAEYIDHVPARGVLILARPEWWHSTTEPPSQVVQSDGAFTLTSIEPQTYRLFARFAQEDGSSYELEVAQRELPLAEGDILHLTLPQTSPPLMEGIEGTIQWVNNVRPDSLDILAYTATRPEDPPVTTQYSQTTLAGNVDSFRITNLAPGAYNLFFQGANIRSALLENIPTSEAPLVVTLEYVPTPTLKISVLRADSGAPIQNYTLALRKQLGLPNLLMYTDKRLYRMTDNTTGQFDIELPGIGTYQALIQSPGYITQTKMLDITGDDDHPLVVAMRQGGNIMGRVMDVTGQGITGASVVAVSQNSETGPIKAITKDGHFTLQTIPEGLATLQISHPDHGSLSLEDLDVVEGITLDLSMITLYLGATIQGYVLDNAGLPVPRATLYVENGSEETGAIGRRLATVITDDTGFYRVSGLPSDLCYVTRRNPSTHTGVVRRSLIGAKETTYDLDFGVGPQVTGLLTDDAGDALANTRLLLSHPANPASRLFQSYAQTDTNGQFTFAGIPAGHYGIYRQLSGTTTWTQVTTFTMSHSDLNLGLVPPRTADLRVSLISGSKLVTSGWRILLQQGHTLWSPFLKQADLPEPGDSRYLLSHVLPGEYCVVAQKYDSSLWIRMPMTLLPNSPDQDLVMDLPDGHITLSGTTNNSDSDDLILFNLDKTLVMPIRNEDGRYTLNHVPAGEYLISNTFLADMAPLEALTLTPDTQALQMPIDTRQWVSTGQGLISVQVAGQDGLPLMSADARLSNGAGALTPLLRTDSELIFIAPIGTYTLTVSHEGFEPQTKEVTIESNPYIALYPERSVIPIRLNTK